jgi:transcriptional regulator with XRE-family HTH domain
MTSKNKADKNFQRRVDQIVGFKSKKEKHEFDLIALHLDIMNKIKCAMDRKRMSQKGLAAKLKVSPSFISQLFSGDKILNLSLINDIKKIFGCNIIIDLEYPTKRIAVPRSTVKAYMKKRNRSDSFKITSADYTDFGIKKDMDNNMKESQL